MAETSCYLSMAKTFWRLLFDWRSFARASFISFADRSALSILQKMATEELVTEQFQFLGIEVSKEVLSKCK